MEVVARRARNQWCLQKTNNTREKASERKPHGAAVVVVQLQTLPLCTTDYNRLTLSPHPPLEHHNHYLVFGQQSKPPGHPRNGSNKRRTSKNMCPNPVVARGANSDPNQGQHGESQPTPCNSESPWTYQPISPICFVEQFAMTWVLKISFEDPPKKPSDPYYTTSPLSSGTAALPLPRDAWVPTGCRLPQGN